jgi:hypothetical protein
LLKKLVSGTLAQPKRTAIGFVTASLVTATDAANHEARRLNRLAAFFFPLATLVADFGMNPPDTVWRNPGFWTALGAGVLLGFLVHALVASRRKKDS